MAGLAWHVHDSPTLQAIFEVLVGTDHQMKALVRQVVTRWNTNFDCLQSHITLKHAINMLITFDPNLEKYQLNKEQWELAHALADQLQVRGTANTFSSIL